MPFFITGDTAILGGSYDTVFSPSFDRRIPTRTPTFFGLDNNEYQIVANFASGDHDLLLVDREAVTRTVVESWTKTELINEVASVSGLTAVPSFFPYAVLGDTKRILFIATGAVHPSVFSIWKVNSSGSLECESAIQFSHISSAFYLIGNFCGVAMAGNQTMDSPIYPIWWSGSVNYINAWRLPSINEFASLNGTVVPNGTGISNNFYDLSGGSGDVLILGRLNSFGSARPFARFGWALPNASGSTRWYWYIGPSDVVSNESGYWTSPGPASTWIASNAATYGNQLVGYLNLGNSPFNLSSAWAPSTTKNVDMTTLQDSLGAPILPFNLTKANGYTYDSEGKADMYPSPTVKKMADGTYLVIFSSFLSSDLYGVEDKLPIGRYMAYRYTPAAESHVLIAKATFNLFPEGVPIARTETFSALEMAVEYDEVTDKFYYYVLADVSSSGGPTRVRDIWGVIEPINGGFDLTSPTFLEEKDPAYADFVATVPLLMPGKNYSSYFRTGPAIKGEGHRNVTSEYITVYCNAVPDGSAWMRGKWDWANAITTKKWSAEQQVYTAMRTNRKLSRKRLLLRGMGPAVQLEFRSEDGKPFEILGWASWDSVDDKP